MANLSKNDVQQIVDNCRKQILDRVLDRQDIVRVNEQIRDRLMNYTQDIMQVQEQRLRRRTDTQMNDINRRMADIETRIYGLEKDSKTTLVMLQQIVQNQGSLLGDKASTSERTPNKAYSAMRYLYQQ